MRDTVIFLHNHLRVFKNTCHADLLVLAWRYTTATTQQRWLTETSPQASANFTN